MVEVEDVMHVTMYIHVMEEMVGVLQVHLQFVLPLVNVNVVRHFMLLQVEQVLQVVLVVNVSLLKLVVMVDLDLEVHRKVMEEEVVEEEDIMEVVEEVNVQVEEDLLMSDQSYKSLQLLSVMEQDLCHPLQIHQMVKSLSVLQLK